MRFLTQLLLTALFYGSVPMLVVLISRKIQAKAFKRICIIWCIVLALIFIVLNSYYETGSTNSYMPAVIWGWVFYKIGCAIIDKRIYASQLNAEPIWKTKKKTKESKSTPNSSANTLETWYTCPNCGCLVRNGENCDCGFQYQTRTVIEPVQEIVERYVQPSYDSIPVNSTSPKPRRHITKQEIFRARYDYWFRVVLVVLAAVGVLGWFRVYQLSEQAMDSSTERENTKKVEQLEELLKHGECPNPYTGDPILNIDDFIEYVQRLNRSLGY